MGVFMGPTYRWAKRRYASLTATGRGAGDWADRIDLAGIEACPLSEWLHRGLREAGIAVVCIETCHAQRFLSAGLTRRRHFRARTSGCRRVFLNPVKLTAKGA